MKVVFQYNKKLKLLIDYYVSDVLPLDEILTSMHVELSDEEWNKMGSLSYKDLETRFFQYINNEVETLIP